MITWSTNNSGLSLAIKTTIKIQGYDRGLKVQVGRSMKKAGTPAKSLKQQARDSMPAKNICIHQPDHCEPSSVLIQYH